MVLGLALLVGMYGCPGTTPTPPPPGCETDADCDDGVFCNGAETCDVESGDCVDGTPPCAEELCVEEDDMCLECLEDADCTDDGNFCTGDPVCNEDNTCGFTGDPCEEGETCNETADRCEVVQAGADFAGENPGVNFDAVVAGEEIELNAPLPEGDFTAAQVACTFVGWTVDGAGTFDPADATPTMYTAAADDTQITATWDCGGVIYALTVDITITTAQTCEEDADCDDGLYCNGIEVCGTNGFCEDGDLPCDPAGFTCEEGDDAAVCVPIAGPTKNFTLNIDNLNGTAQADTFVAGQELAPGTATSVPTLQNGDTANGLAGTDTLKASYSNNTGADVTIAPTLTGIEILEFTNFGGANVTTISGTNFTGAQEIYSVTSLANTPITGLAELTDLGVTNSDFDLAVTLVSPATNANDDLVNLYLNGTKDSDKDTDGGGADTDTAGC
ncbi:MAG: hypothetical protein JXB13_04825, partial [Phycisphaerae bacterium]|nr:hypothetical protein [Phycisphaerae bacterium]